ncbi:MAG TPA: hypothetical protein VFJ57_00185 [Solirubrobacterales bacterium]|nr:hypothetical protein [Solirubrobacterales bacterium]
MRTASKPVALVVVVVLSVVGGVAFAAAANKESAIVGNVEFSAGGGFAPKALSKTKQTPIALTAEGKIKTVDGTHPPALKEVQIETDKNGSIQVKGYPTCKASQLQSQDSAHAEAACKDALIGTGTTTATVAFAESKEVQVPSKLLVFNGGEKGGVVTLYVHAYFSNPIPGAIVTTVKVKKIHKGRYGLLSVASIPTIAGGSGSVASFKLKIDKKYTYQGKKVSVLSAKCPDGKLQAHATGVFTDGTRISTEFVRTCTGKG